MGGGGVKMSKTGTELYEERRKRIFDAIELRKPDRVPIFLENHLMPAKYYGMTFEEAYYDQDKWLEANQKFLRDFEPDMYFSPDAPIITPGPINDLWGTMQMKWPGHGVANNVSFQFVEGEYMKQEEYDHFLDDPSDFLIRVYYPRVFKNLKDLSLLPSLKIFALGCYGGSVVASLLDNPAIYSAIETMKAAAKTGAEWMEKFMQFAVEMKDEGFVASHTAPIIIPFDLISDLLRSMRGTMLDMYQCPEKLLAAEDKLYPFILDSAIQTAQMSGNPIIFIPLHRGSDGFMSIEQFEKFYWPYLKNIILDLIKAGLTPMPFFEGTYDQRLKYLAELPKGKILGVFDRSDLVKVKEVLKDTMCISGGMPIALLQTGTKEIVKEQAKKMIDVVGKDGGFIMNSSTVLDEAKPDLVKFWVEFTKEYGVYR